MTQRPLDTVVTIRCPIIEVPPRAVLSGWKPVYAVATYESPSTVDGWTVKVETMNEFGQVLQTWRNLDTALRGVPDWLRVMLREALPDRMRGLLS